MEEEPIIVHDDNNHEQLNGKASCQLERVFMNPDDLSDTDSTIKDNPKEVISEVKLQTSTNAEIQRPKVEITRGSPDPEHEQNAFKQCLLESNSAKTNQMTVFITEDGDNKRRKSFESISFGKANLKGDSKVKQKHLPGFKGDQRSKTRGDSQTTSRSVEKYDSEDEQEVEDFMARLKKDPDPEAYQALRKKSGAADLQGENFCQEKSTLKITLDLYFSADIRRGLTGGAQQTGTSLKPEHHYVRMNFL